jgi:hypothetical protein
VVQVPVPVVRQEHVTRQVVSKQVQPVQGAPTTLPTQYTQGHQAVGFGAPIGVAAPSFGYGAPMGVPTPGFGVPMGVPTPGFGVPMGAPTPGFGSPDLAGPMLAAAVRRMSF